MCLDQVAEVVQVVEAAEVRAEADTEKDGDGDGAAVLQAAVMEAEAVNQR